MKRTTVRILSKFFTNASVPNKRFASSKAAKRLDAILAEQLKDIESQGLYKRERVITTSQDAQIGVLGKTNVLNFCANNYLGLSNNKELIDAATHTMKTHGLGVSSVRFICGTQDIHKKLEEELTKFHKTEATILFPSAFDANAGIFEAILTEQDAVISDTLNHASIIDGIRLCKAQRFRYNHLDMADLESKLEQTQTCRMRMIVTDGVFSMDGDVAPLDKIVTLADKYDAIVFVDECHATGFFGPTGRGVPEYFGVMDRVDIINSTLGKALGGATGGYTTGLKTVVDMLRQRARPYLFSNSIAPPLVGASLKTLEILTTSSELRDRLNANTKLFRTEMKKAGFTIAGNDSCPIAPVMLGDARLASEFADDMLQLGIYVIGFSFPVVPKGQARIRVQLSAAHSTEQVQRAINAFIEIGKKRKVIK